MKGGADAPPNLSPGCPDATLPVGTSMKGGADAPPNVLDGGADFMPLSILQ